MKQPEYTDITIEVRQDQGVTIAFAFTEGFDGQGVARCHPDDSFALAIGRDLAIGRALKDLGRQYERAGYATVKRIDEGRKRSRALRELHRRQRLAQGLPVSGNTVEPEAAPADAIIAARAPRQKRSFFGRR